MFNAVCRCVGECLSRRRGKRSLGGDVVRFLLVAGLFAQLSGCARGHYRASADRETYDLIKDRASNRPWATEKGFSIQPDKRSRIADSSDPNDPALPNPGPNLYAYELPVLNEIVSEGPQSKESGTLEASEAAPKSTDSTPAETRIGGLTVQPIPKTYWESLPDGCLGRMMEFLSVREEYQKRYGEGPPQSLIDQSKRLSLKSIIQLALIESREYQSQKEQLYRAALSLTRERFNYRPRFAPNGLRSDGTASQTRSDGSSENSVAVGSTAQVNQSLPTGGSLLARLANDVVLRFDGPDGFTTDIGSSFLFELNQSLLQRDVRLNPLIQAERDLVYAARDYARFRKTFFEGLASRYYSLLQTYRSVEIESQNYFSVIRTFEQARAEVRAGVKNAPNQVAVDQFEQSMLSGRSGLISTWNGLEQSLDELKLALGVPTETSLNIDLGELGQLTVLDEIEVAGGRVRRWQSRVEDRLANPNPDRNDLVNANIFLIERLLEWFELRRKMGLSGTDTTGLELQLAEFQVGTASLSVQQAEVDLAAGEATATRNPIIMRFQGNAALNEATLNQVVTMIRLAGKRSVAPSEIDSIQETLDDLREAMKALYVELDVVLKDPVRENLDALLSQALGIGERAKALKASLQSLLGDTSDQPSEAELLGKTIASSRQLLEQTDEWLAQTETGLLPINIQMDDAMATALVQRLDLMNERGRLADDWRNIKLAADDLKTVLNLNAAHAMTTRDNKPFNFSDEESQTRIGLSLDLPINRIQQRNNYRNSLIRYQSQRRELMAFEDRIKLDIRNRMRDMAQTRLQYPISVTRAALAAEQVTSIRLQLALGVPGVRGVDLVDALQDLRQSLINVANFRIRYIIADARFALDLESMQLDELGFWPHINDPDFQPVRNLLYPESAGPTYGDIPPFLKVSKMLKRLVDQPLPGESAVESE